MRRATRNARQPVARHIRDPIKFISDQLSILSASVHVTKHSCVSIPVQLFRVIKHCIFVFSSQRKQDGTLFSSQRVELRSKRLSSAHTYVDFEGRLIKTRPGSMNIIKTITRIKSKPVLSVSILAISFFQILSTNKQQDTWCFPFFHRNVLSLFFLFLNHVKKFSSSGLAVLLFFSFSFSSRLFILF